MSRTVRTLALTTGLLSAVAVAAPLVAQTPREAPRAPAATYTSDGVRAETLVRGLEHPWGFEFLPDGRMIVTERPGRLRLVGADGKLSEPLDGVPRVQAQGQGGLLDVALDPAFAENRLVYLSYAEPGDGGTAGTAVARGRLGERGLDDVRVIYRQHPKVRGGGHFGSRIVFARDGTIFVTQGDRFNESDQAQDLSSGIGKIVRIGRDGSIPRDNPFAGREGARPEIWSLGHRNVQAAVLHPGTGRLWTVEHGARGGDELNQPEAGKNYGWPVVSYGVHYSGARIGEGTTKAGMEPPVYYWDPVIAPSGMAIYTGDRFAGWKGSVLVGSLTPGGLVRLTLDGDRVTREARYLRDLGRVRDVRQGPDGLIYVLTDDNNGRLVRIAPRS